MLLIMIETLMRIIRPICRQIFPPDSSRSVSPGNTDTSRLIGQEERPGYSMIDRTAVILFLFPHIYFLLLLQFLG